MNLEYWNKQIERWVDIFSDDEPDLMGLELVREFDNLAKKFHSDFNDDLNNWSEPSVSLFEYRNTVISEEVDIFLESSYPSITPNNYAKVKRTERMAEPVPISAFDTGIETTIEGIGKASSEDVIVSDKNVKMVLQLPNNNKKENIKVVANDDSSITISHLNYEGRRCSRNLKIPYDINFQTAKATYRNGILEVTFDRI
jgi:HSP20 family molecular chaperone IbpA